MEAVTARHTGHVAPAKACTHERLIDDILTKDGQRTGEVRCLECGVVFDDPCRRQT